MVDYSSVFEAPPMSRGDLRKIAQSLRNLLNVKTPYFPIIGLLESMDVLFGIDYDYIDDKEWDKRYGKHVHAQYDLDKKTIFIKESVYERANKNYGRDRFTIAHEISHAILISDNKVKFCRVDKNAEQIPLYKNPEWQADCLAGELLVPYSLCRNMSEMQIVTECAVTRSAAHIQKSKF